MVRVVDSNERERVSSITADFELALNDIITHEPINYKNVFRRKKEHKEDDFNKNIASRQTNLMTSRDKRLRLGTELWRYEDMAMSSPRISWNIASKWLFATLFMVSHCGCTSFSRTLPKSNLP